MVIQNGTVVPDKNDAVFFYYITLIFNCFGASDRPDFQLIADYPVAIQDLRCNVSGLFGAHSSFEWVNIQLKTAVISEFGLAPIAGFDIFDGV